MPVSGAAAAVGALGARLWYRVLHRDRPESGRGWAVQGFVAGFVLVLALALLIARGPARPVLDATAPALLFALGVGRVGCFFSGCCAGRPTSGRLGVLASDRRLLIRRVPTQLYEAAASMALAAATMIALDALPTLAGSGIVLVAALALHVLVRQLILPMHAEARRTARGRTVVMAVSLGALMAAAAAVLAI